MELKLPKISLAVAMALSSSYSFALVEELVDGSTLAEISVVNGDQVSIKNNGSVTVENNGAVSATRAVAGAYNGTLDLGSGSTINATHTGTGEFYALRSGMTNDNSSITANNLNINLDKQTSGNMTAGVFAHSSNKGTNTVELNGLTTINMNVANATYAYGLYAMATNKNGSNGSITADDVNIKMTTAAVNSFGMVTGGGNIEVKGDANLEFNIIGGKTTTIIGSTNSSGQKGQTKLNGNTNIIAKLATDNHAISGVAGYSQGTLTANNVNIVIDGSNTQGSEIRFVEAERIGTTTINGTLKTDYIGDQNNDVTYVRSSGTNSFVVLNGNSYIGTDSKDDSHLAFYATSNGKITTNGSTIVSYGQLSADGGTLDINAGSNSYLKGSAQVANSGVSNLTLNNQSAWDMTADSTVTNLSLNNSAVNFLHNDDTFKTLTVSGDYAGNNGLIIINTTLDDDASATDKLIIEGNSSGTTRVSVNNVGGLGAQTVDGIEVIQIHGNSDGTFVKQGRIVAGTYEYNITRGDDVTTDSKNWYLTSRFGVEDPAVRPESGSYLANLAAGNSMFIFRLHDRVGKRAYIDPQTGEYAFTNLWLTQEGGHNRSADSSKQLKILNNRSVTKLGFDLAQWDNDNQAQLNVGVMAGYGYAHNNSTSKVTGYRSTGTVSGYSLGLYGTLYSQNSDNTGGYVDTWVNYNWLNNKVSGDELATEQYDSRGFGASIETGYNFKLSESNSASYYLQPKAQLVWMNVKAKDHTEYNGTRVTGNSDNLQTRLGLRAMMQDQSENFFYQPFIEANWLHNSKNLSVNMDDVTTTQNGAKDVFELKAGLEGQFNKNTSGWLNIAQQLGNNDYRDTSIIVGAKYSF